MATDQQKQDVQDKKDQLWKDFLAGEPTAERRDEYQQAVAVLDSTLVHSSLD